MLTLRPRLSSRQPMDAAAMPFPREETTPPVTNMYLAMVLWYEKGLDVSEVFGRVYANGFVFSFGNTNGDAVFQSAELFELFGIFERAGLQRRIAEQERAAVDVEADVFPKNGVFAARVGDGRAGKVEGAAGV